MGRPKAMGSWSGMRKYLEKEMLAQGLRGRVRYACPTDRSLGLFEICVDGRVAKRFSIDDDAFGNDFVARGEDVQAVWDRYWQEFRKLPPREKAEHSDADFACALRDYRSLPIADALASENPLIRMFAILDRRVGKRTLERLRGEIARQPEWLKEFYLLRLGAEGIAADE